jgi:hypothetical protein
MREFVKNESNQRNPISARGLRINRFTNVAGGSNGLIIYCTIMQATRDFQRQRGLKDEIVSRTGGGGSI